MAGVFSFKCEECGEIHEGSPSFGCVAPDPWLAQTDEVREEGKIGSDLCCYADDGRPVCSIRTTLEVPIRGVDEPFLWGVWVSVSWNDFIHYAETWGDPDTSKPYFGHIANRLPYNGFVYDLTADICPQSDDCRPLVKLHEADHPLYRDFIDGISIEKAQEIVQVAEMVVHGATKH